MTSQMRIDVERKPFVLSGDAFSKELTLAQDAGRTVGDTIRYRLSPLIYPC